jgi:ADP-ribosylation factor 2-binding protein
MINILSSTMDSFNGIDSTSGHKSKTNSKDLQFDSIIGHIEDILMLPEWVDLCTSFFSKHAPSFSLAEDIDSNKLEYTQIFEVYVEQMESFIEAYLKEQVTGFSMQDFLYRLFYTYLM